MHRWLSSGSITIEHDDTESPNPEQVPLSSVGRDVDLTTSGTNSASGNAKGALPSSKHSPKRAGNPTNSTAEDIISSCGPGGGPSDEDHDPEDPLLGGQDQVPAVVVLPSPKSSGNRRPNPLAESYAASRDISNLEL